MWYITKLIPDYIIVTFKKSFFKLLLCPVSILYNTIQYDMVDLRALKSWWDGQLNLVYDTETKNKEKLKTKTK